MNIAYPVKEGLYLNITNRCPCDCVFCLRRNADGVYGSKSLWLEREPTVEEILAAIGEHDLKNYRELVFCGYGEPTERLSDVVAVAKKVKETTPALPIRLNTNGLAELINGRCVAAELSGCIDTVSISLNTPDADEYVAICRPSFGKCSWQAMIDFARACREYIPNVVFTIVGEPITSAENQELCRKIAADAGVKLRIRPYEPGA